MCYCYHWSISISNFFLVLLILSLSNLKETRSFENIPVKLENRKIRSKDTVFPSKQFCAGSIRSRSKTSLRSSTNDYGDSDAEENKESSQQKRPKMMPQPPKFTTLEIKRRESERRLLKQLLNGDDAIAELRKLWFGERGMETEQLLYEADAGIGHPSNWTLAESILEELIEDDPTYIEPFVRLSKLYCLQGRFEESRIMCDSALIYRPWHYVALETMVACYLAQGQDNQQLVEWAKKRLPTPSHKELRKQWVEQAIKDSIRIQQDSIDADKSLLQATNDEEDNSNSSWQ